MGSQPPSENVSSPQSSVDGFWIPMNAINVPRVAPATKTRSPNAVDDRNTSSRRFQFRKIVVHCPYMSLKHAEEPLVPPL